MPFKYFVCKGNLSWIVRLFHCGITFGVVGGLLFSQSKLNEMFIQLKNLPVSLSFLFIHVITLSLYLIISYFDPGFANIDYHIESSSDDNESDCEIDSTLLKSEGKKLLIKNKHKINNFNHSKFQSRFCVKCNIEQPLRCRHCDECGRCVLKYDHHCPWIDNCIGEYNHPIFLIFLHFELAAIIWTFYISWISIITSVQWIIWINLNKFFLMNIIICILGGIPLICLLIFHLYLAFTNSTTWETAAREKITYLRKLKFDINPFHLGYCSNIVQFCCRYDYPKKWEVVYLNNCKKDGSIDCESM